MNGWDLKPEHLDALSVIGDMLNASDDAMAAIEGRASQTGKEEFNEILSQRRADALYNWLVPVSNVEETKIIETVGLGSIDPIHDRPGMEDSINRSARLTYQIPFNVVVPPPAPKPPPSVSQESTRNWSIRVNLSASAVKAKIGGTGFLGQIKNRDTGDVRNGVYTGYLLGAGAGLGLPQASFGDWEDFKTDQEYVMDDFHLTLARYTSLGATLFIGYTFAYVSFPNLGANSISVGGFDGGSVGLEGGTGVGMWTFID